ncbi:MAG: AraC family transcriptional regulator, partial [Saprospiraceae bacterium]
MKTIGLVLPYDFKLFSVASVLDVFETLNGLYLRKSKELPFKLLLVQSGQQILLTGKSFLGYPVFSIRSNLKLDIVIIPSFTSTDLNETIEKNKLFIPWLHKQFNAGAEIASLCTGAFLFA